MTKRGTPTTTSLQFFAKLKWLDGTPLIDGIEEYRRTIFTKALDSFDEHGRPLYSLVLSGRGKKNAKSLDLILAALFVLVIRRSVQGSDGIHRSHPTKARPLTILSLAKKLVAAQSRSCGRGIAAREGVAAERWKRLAEDHRGPRRRRRPRQDLRLPRRRRTAHGSGLVAARSLGARSDEARRAAVDHELRQHVSHPGRAVVRLDGDRQGGRRQAHVVQLVQRRPLHRSRLRRSAVARAAGQPVDGKLGGRRRLSRAAAGAADSFRSVSPPASQSARRA